MEIICLNCQGEFETEGGRPPVPGAVIKCPRCGAEEVFFPVGGRPLPRMSASTGPREAAGEGAFRKPQSLNIRRTAPVETPKTSQTGPVPPVRRDTDSIPPLRRPLSGPVEVIAPAQMPDGTTAVGAAGAQKGTGTSSEDPGPEWMVKSPTGLVLEFPSPSVLAAWAAVVDNPAPYQVCRAGGEWMPLEVFLQEFKRGARFTQGFRVPAISGRSSGGVGAAPSPDAGPPVTEPTSAPASNPTRTPTTGFTFKVANTSKPPSPGWVKPLFWVLFLALAGAGGYFLWLLSR